jgi:hypothetical protein
VEPSRLLVKNKCLLTSSKTVEGPNDRDTLFSKSNFGFSMHIFKNVTKRFPMSMALKNYKSTLNFTQDFIYTWIRNDVILAPCRALEIICGPLSEPYWKFAADDSKCAIDMGNRLILKPYKIALKSSVFPSRLLVKNKCLLTSSKTVEGPNDRDTLFSKSNFGFSMHIFKNVTKNCMNQTQILLFIVKHVHQII